MPKRVNKLPKVAQQMPAEKRPLRVAAYCRVSTRHEEQQHSLATQIKLLHQLYSKSSQLGCWVDVYSDTVTETNTNHCPNYQKLMKNRTKKVDLILVKSLSRFGRDALRTIRQIRRLKKWISGFTLGMED